MRYPRGDSSISHILEVGSWQRMVAWLLLAICLAAIAVLSLLPSVNESWVGGWDASLRPSLQNLLHVPAYAVLMAIALWTAYVSDRFVAPIILLAGLCCVVYGIVLEWLQAAAIPGRTGCVSDALLNAAGVAVTLVIVTPICLRRSGK